MTTTYDAKAGAWYMRITDHPVVRTEQIGPGTLVDFDKDGAVVGVEVIRGQA